jgi:hypothetical protein
MVANVQHHDRKQAGNQKDKEEIQAMAGGIDVAEGDGVGEDLKNLRHHINL